MNDNSRPSKLKENINNDIQIYLKEQMLDSEISSAPTDCLAPWNALTLIQAWISNYIHSIVWGEITYELLNFNGCNVEV